MPSLPGSTVSVGMIQEAIEPLPPNHTETRLNGTQVPRIIGAVAAPASGLAWRNRRERNRYRRGVILTFICATSDGAEARHHDCVVQCDRRTCNTRR